MINQLFLPLICTVTEQLLERATRACFRWVQVFPHCTGSRSTGIPKTNPSEATSSVFTPTQSKCLHCVLPWTTTTLYMSSSGPSLTACSSLHTSWLRQGTEGHLQHWSVLHFLLFSSGLLTQCWRFSCFCLSCQTPWPQQTWGSHKAESYVSKGLMEWPWVICRKVATNG